MDTGLEGSPHELASSGGAYIRFLEQALRQTRSKLAVALAAKEQADEQRHRAAVYWQNRVKNTLAVIRAISQRTRETSRTLEDYGNTFSARLDTLARVQTLLARAPGGVELEELVRDELTTSVGREGERVSIEGPRVLMKGEAVEAVALALHELTVNALKFGALSRQHGKLDIGWEVAESAGAARLRFQWLERGVRVLNPNPSRVGFGREMLERALPSGLAAETKLAFTPGGVRFVAELPLGERIAVADSPAGPDET